MEQEQKMCISCKYSNNYFAQKSINKPEYEPSVGEEETMFTGYLPSCLLFFWSCSYYFVFSCFKDELNDLF